MQVKVGNHTAEGTGTNKKVAKRNAAENMLEILGFKVPQAQPTKPALKSEEKVSAGLSLQVLSPPYPGPPRPSIKPLSQQLWGLRRGCACLEPRARLWVEPLLFSIFVG